MSAEKTESYAELGRYSRSITTRDSQAKAWFDRGLVWAYGFNMEEAARCFERAAAADPNCAMAHWGIAYSRGPFYNKVWEYFGATEAAETLSVCHRAAAKAAALAAAATPVEQALAAAILQRFPQPQLDDPAQYTQWEKTFAFAMRDAHARFPDDPDVAAVAGLALMTLTPWNLWDLRTGAPTPGSHAIEAQRILEAGLAAAERQGVTPHPGLAHIYIHVMEMSQTPEKALAAADSLFDYSRDCGHLHHMPSHIYAQCGLYHDAIVVNEKAVAADRRYVAPPGASEYYILDRSHHLHMLAFVACMQGRFRTALEAAEAIGEVLSEDVLRRIENPYLARSMEGYLGHRLDVLVRFGRWHDIIAEPLPGPTTLYPVTSAMTHYAKGVAHAALGDTAAADRARDDFLAACQRIPEDRFFHNNPAADILAVAAAMLDGEVAYRKARYDEAFDHLRRAVVLDDALAYSEPWPWMHPPRHALGALLLEQGRIEEAARHYRADLGLDGTVQRAKQNRGNVWALHGLHECLERLGLSSEAALLAGPLQTALARADVPITASCACRRSVCCCC